MKTCKSLSGAAVLIVLFLAALPGAGLPARATGEASPSGQGFGPVLATTRARSSAAGNLLRPSPLLRSTTGSAASILWQPYPVYGGEMTSIAMPSDDAQTVYVGTRDAGVFKATDGGATWQPARQGLTFFPIRSLQVDPLHPDILYAGTDFDGIWKTTDAGATWASASAGLELDMVVINVVIDPLDTDVLYAVLAGGYGLAAGHLYRSSDGGATWQVRDNGIPRYLPWSEYIFGPRSLAVNPEDPSHVYAGTLEEAYASTDAGANWVTITANLPGDSVKALAMDPHHANRLSAIVGQEYYVYQGGAWQEISQGTYYPNFGLWDYLYFHPSDASIVYSAGQMFTKSTDAGVTWSWDYDPNAGTVSASAFHPLTPDTLYAACSQTRQQPGGVYKTTDGGLSWTPASQGITAVNIGMVAMDPQNPNYIYAGDDEGHLLRSLDGGTTWESHLIDLTSADVWGIVVDPLDSQHIHVVEEMYVYESFDQGETFSQTEEIQSSPYCIAIAPDASSPVYVGTVRYGIYRSLDSGATWTQVNQGVPLCYQGTDICAIHSLAVDPNVTSTVWAGTQVDPYDQGGIIKSTDRGEHWEVKGLREESIEAIAVQPGDSNTILAGASFLEGNLYKSTDGGASWQLKLGDIAPVKQIVFDPRDPNTVYAATEGYGVLRSRDGGESWHDYSTGIFYPVLYSLAISEEDSPLLLAGSYGSGLYGLRPVLENRPPDTPSDPTPANGAIGVPLDQVLGWSSSDPDGDPITYTIAFGTSSPPPAADTITTTAYNPGLLVTGTTYYWAITATDGISATAGPVWSFTTIQPYRVYLPMLRRSTGGKQ
jgi:photosystem II stability/assembly factor-like uncharacterized protein